MDEFTLPVTFTFIALYGIAIFSLVAWIGIYRGKINALRGDGGDPILFKRSRIHGNLTENAPVMIAALGVSEHLGLSDSLLWTSVASFGVGRLLHFALYDRPMRGVPMGLTTFPALLMGGWILVTVWVR